MRLLLLLLFASLPLPGWAAGERAPAAAAVSAEQLGDVAAGALFAGLGGNLEARPVGNTDAGPLQPPAGVLSLQARLPAGALPARRMVVNVDILVDGRHWRTVPTWFAVQAWRPVWVARAGLAPGPLAEQDQFVAERRDVTGLASPPLPLDQPLDGLRLRSALAAGAVLTAAAVESRPAVARQQSVSVRVSAGTVVLQTVGVALADGRIGDLVRVLNPASQQSYAARVVADGLVVAAQR